MNLSVSDIKTSIAKVGDCKKDEIIVSPIIPMRNGLCMTWIKCPISVAIKVAKNGKIPLGWTIARIELQKPRKKRCFRCWELGHHMGACRSEIDRSQACFRCGKDGHSSASCEREVHCVLCEAKNLDARHRTGSYKCNADNISNIENKENKSERRPIVNNTSNDKDTPM